MGQGEAYCDKSIREEVTIGKLIGIDKKIKIMYKLIRGIIS